MAQQSTLRKLARSHSEEKIDKNKYRSERTLFFEALIAGNVDLPQEDDVKEKINSDDTFSDVTLNKNSEAKSETPSVNEKKSEEGLFQQKNKLIFGGVGAAVVIVILLMIFSGSDDTPTQPSQASSSNQSQPTVVDAPPSPLENHISNFLSANLWSQANLDAFLIDWQTYSDSDKASAANSTEFSRLVNEISKKLLEERALAAIGNPQTSYEKQRQLVEFANTIGIRDQRITLPDAP